LRKHRLLLLEALLLAVLEAMLVLAVLEAMLLVEMLLVEMPLRAVQLALI
jgi:hypothetical protein